MIRTPLVVAIALTLMTVLFIGMTTGAPEVPVVDPGPEPETNTRGYGGIAPDIVIYGNNGTNESATPAPGDGDIFAYQVLTGDFNGNGQDDLVVSSPWADGKDDQFNQTGEVYIIFDSTLQGMSGGFAAIGSKSDVTIYGHEANDRIGNTLAVGDFDNDGHDDIAIGARFANNFYGKVYVINGNGSMPSEIYLNTSMPGWHANATINAQSAFDAYFGYEMVTGDLNADGFDDLIVSSPDAQGLGVTEPTAGRVYVFRGSGAGISASSTMMANTVIYGPESGDNAGLGLAIGDISGNGTLDLAIGMPDGDGQISDARMRSGEVRLLYGPVTAGSYNLISDHDTVIWGDDAGDKLGMRVHLADITGDGKDDVICAAPESDGKYDKYDEAGEISIVFGAEPGYMGSEIDLDVGGNALTIYSNYDNDYFGYDFASGDMDGDTIPDLFVGAGRGKGEFDDQWMVGEMYYIPGSGDWTYAQAPIVSEITSGYSLIGKDDDDRFGWTFDIVDYDNDGTNDLAVSAKWADGENDDMERCGELWLYNDPSFDRSYIDTIEFPGWGSQSSDPYALFAGYPHTIWVNTSGPGSAPALETLKIWLMTDHGGVNITYDVVDGYQEDNDTYDMIDVISDPSDIETTATGKNIPIKLMFNWGSLNDHLTGMRVYLKCTAQLGFVANVAMEWFIYDDITINGNATFTVGSEAGDEVEGGDWIMGPDTLFVHNLSLVYDGHPDVAPSSGAFSIVQLNDSAGVIDTFFDTGSWDIQIAIPNMGTDRYNITLYIGIASSGKMTMNQTFTGKDYWFGVDNSTPSALSGLTFHDELLTDPAVIADNDDTILVAWDAVTDVGSGLFEYELTATSPTSVVTTYNTTETSYLVTNLTEGNWGFSISALDNVGHVAPYLYQVLLIDMTGPSIASVLPANGSTILNNTLTISADFTDAASDVDNTTFMFKIVPTDNGTDTYDDWTSFDNISVSTVQTAEKQLFLANGEYTLYIKGADMAGNMAEYNHTFAVEFIAPNFAPVPVIDLPTVNTTLVDSSSVTLSSTGTADIDGDTLSYFWFAGTELISTNANDNVDLEAGTYTITLWVDDGMGHNVSATVTVDVLLDTDADGTPDVNDADDDGDNVPDSEEEAQGTDPLDPDTDGDGYNDDVDYYPTDASRHEKETSSGGLELWMIGAIVAVIVVILLVAIIVVVIAIVMKGKKKEPEPETEPEQPDLSGAMSPEQVVEEGTKYDDQEVVSQGGEEPVPPAEQLPETPEALPPAGETTAEPPGEVPTEQEVPTEELPVDEHPAGEEPADTTTEEVPLEETTTAEPAEETTEEVPEMQPVEEEPMDVSLPGDSTEPVEEDPMESTEPEQETPAESAEPAEGSVEQEDAQV